MFSGRDFPPASMMYWARRFMMSGGVVCPPVEPVPAWGLAAQVSPGFKMSGMKPAADAATNPVLMRLRRENPVFFMSRFLSGAYSSLTMRGLPSKALAIQYGPRHKPEAAEKDIIGIQVSKAINLERLI